MRCARLLKVVYLPFYLLEDFIKQFGRELMYFPFFYTSVLLIFSLVLVSLSQWTGLAWLVTVLGVLASLGWLIWIFRYMHIIYMEAPLYKWDARGFFGVLDMYVLTDLCYGLIFFSIWTVSPEQFRMEADLDVSKKFAIFVIFVANSASQLAGLGVTKDALANSPFTNILYTTLAVMSFVWSGIILAFVVDRLRFKVRRLKARGNEPVLPTHTPPRPKEQPKKGEWRDGNGKVILVPVNAAVPVGYQNKNKRT
jgi:hypothetical protein